MKVFVGFGGAIPASKFFICAAILMLLAIIIMAIVILDHVFGYDYDLMPGEQDDTPSFTAIVRFLIKFYVYYSFLVFVFIVCLVCFAVCIGNLNSGQSVLNLRREDTSNLSQALKMFPYGNLISRPENLNTCSICLNEFKEGDDVVQLKCSKYHIFHYDCIKPIQTGPARDRKCPMCRKPIEV